MSGYDGTRYYHNVPGLLVPKSLISNEMDDNINAFIDTIPGLAISMEDDVLALAPGNMKNNFSASMETLISLLKRVYAKGLETEAVRILRYAADANSLPSAKKNFKPFITDILSLSVAMQKAQANSESDKESAPSKIEIYVTIAKSLNAVSNLMEDGLHEPARVLLSDLTEHHPDSTVFQSLMQMFNAKNYNEAAKTISSLKDKFNETISKLAGTDMNKKILAVDDMPEILSFVNNALKNNYKVIAVPGGNAALKVMETQKPDLFILDIDMPEMDGFELAVRIRMMPEHATTPIIFLTGNSSREHINNATQVGGNEFIVKPASHDYLLTKVGGFLSV